ncbi:MAG: hypothetical protein ABJK28_12155 [Algibacter sp.]
MANNNRGKRIYHTSKYVCKYLSEQWLTDGKSTREYGRLYGVHYHTIEKIMEKDGYNIPLFTLSIICFNKGVKLSDFFEMVEDKYGAKLNDTFIMK